MTGTITAQQAADELHLARSTVIDYLRTGRIPGGFQPVEGGRWLVDEDVYRAWRDERRAAVDPHRIEPRSARSKAAQNRRRK
ncbi:helix-turn-helix domain-containing protein [Cellulomonas sp. URHB0016]